MATRARTTPGIPRIAGHSPFVGRERELAALGAMLQRTAQGSGFVVLVAGEPGIGKTRLLTEVAERAAAEGWRVLFGRAYESEGMPPYLPFTEALRKHLADCSLSDLHAQLGRGAAEVALLVPELLEQLPGIESSPPLSREERFRLFEGVTRFLVNIARAGEPGLLLALEDLHCADEASLWLLEHLGRRLSEVPLLVVATCRAAPADRSQTFTEVMTGLHRARQCEQLDVSPFSAQEAGRLVEHLAGASPARAVIEALNHQTGGNPFFLEEVVRNLQTEGRDLADEHSVTVVPVPESVRQVIGVRLSRLHPESVRALQLAAALGDPFSFDALAAAAGAALAPLLDWLDEASASGFVREEGSGDYHFSHALVRETVYTGLSSPRRALLHAQVAQKLEVLYKANAVAHAGELAHHFLLGGRQADLMKAMGYALQAADRATAQTAFEEAVRYYQMALDAHEKSDERDEASRCEMLLALATASRKAGDLQRCDEINLAAAEAAKAAGLPDMLARACFATADYAPLPNPRLIPLLEDALEATADGDSDHRSKLLAVLACQRAMGGLWEESMPMREESLAMARRLGDVRTLVFVVHNAFRSDVNRIGRLEEWMRTVEEVIQLGRELGDKLIEDVGHCDHLQGSLVRGDIAAVDAGIAAHARLSGELQRRDMMGQGHPFILRSMRALLSGPLFRVEELENERERFERTINKPWDERFAAHFRLILRWEQGRLAELQPASQAALERHPTPLGQACLAFICSELGDGESARLARSVGHGPVRRDCLRLRPGARAIAAVAGLLRHRRCRPRRGPLRPSSPGRPLRRDRCHCDSLPRLDFPLSRPARHDHRPLRRRRAPLR
jgi:AAA ATPase domain